MAVYVGSARSDENGGAHSGKAGDQKSGKEVSTQKWYRHSKGWRVFRAKDRAVALKICEAMEAACKNEKIGYDQWQRNTLYTQAEKVGFDIGKVKIACETDCSALVRVCCAWAGITDLPADMRTGDMPKTLMKTGAFVELKGSKYTEQDLYLGKGDILVTRTSGHTVVVLDDGKRYDGAVKVEVYKLGERILRHGDEGADVMQMQSYLVDLGYDLGDFGDNRDGIDGDFGDTTEIQLMKFQRANALEVDGEYGTESHKAMLKCIEVMNSTPPVDTEEKPKTVIISGGDCYVRTAPNTDGEKLGVATRGTVLQFQGQISDNGWPLIIWDNKNGWVSGKYAQLS